MKSRLLELLAYGLAGILVGILLGFVILGIGHIFANF